MFVFYGSGINVWGEIRFSKVYPSSLSLHKGWLLLLGRDYINASLPHQSTSGSIKSLLLTEKGARSELTPRNDLRG